MLAQPLPVSAKHHKRAQDIGHSIHGPEILAFSGKGEADHDANGCAEVERRHEDIPSQCHSDRSCLFRLLQRFVSVNVTQWLDEQIKHDRRHAQLHHHSECDFHIVHEARLVDSLAVADGAVEMTRDRLVVNVVQNSETHHYPKNAETLWEIPEE